MPELPPIMSVANADQNALGGEDTSHEAHIQNPLYHPLLTNQLWNGVASQLQQTITLRVQMYPLTTYAPMIGAVLTQGVHGIR